MEGSWDLQSKQIKEYVKNVSILNKKPSKSWIYKISIGSFHDGILFTRFFSPRRKRQLKTLWKVKGIITSRIQFFDNYKWNSFPR